MNKSNTGLALKIFAEHPHFYKRSHVAYRKYSGLPTASPSWDTNGMSGVGSTTFKSKTMQNQMLRERVTPFLADALKSIKRDFQGVPIMLAWQAIAPRYLRTYQDQLGDNFYNDMYDHVKQSVIGHINDKWYFLNVHKRNESAPRTRWHQCAGKRGIYGQRKSQER